MSTRSATSVPLIDVTEAPEAATTVEGLPNTTRSRSSAPRDTARAAPPSNVVSAQSISRTSASMDTRLPKVACPRFSVLAVIGPKCSVVWKPAPAKLATSLADASLKVASPANSAFSNPARPRKRAPSNLASASNFARPKFAAPWNTCMSKLARPWK